MGFLAPKPPTPTMPPPPPPSAHPAVLGSQSVQLAGDKVAKDAKTAAGLGAEGTIKTSAQGLGTPATAKSTLLGG